MSIVRRAQAATIVRPYPTAAVGLRPAACTSPLDETPPGGKRFDILEIPPPAGRRFAKSILPAHHWHSRSEQVEAFPVGLAEATEEPT